MVTDVVTLLLSVGGRLRVMRIRRAVALAALAAIGIGQSVADGPARRAQLVIVVDGLRPDYVTRELMPRLVALGSRGIVFNAHHSIVPTVTRVNASSMVTGTYPETHGLLGNTVYVAAAHSTTRK